MPPLIEPSRRTTAILAHRALSPTAFELRLRRDNLPFRAGQLLTLHGPTPLDDRSYSIASGEQDDELRVLYRLIPGGRLTPWLAGRRVGEELEISGPYGEFTVSDPAQPLVFIGTGTGIAPARAYLRSHPGLRLTVLHGVRRATDLFYREELAAGTAYHPCLSGETAPGCWAGRVSEAARTLTFPAGARYHLCGANAMFYDLREILTARGIALANISSEAYYYEHDD